MQSLSDAAAKADMKTNLRLAVKPEYTGESDEDVLAGACTAEEAKEVFRKYFEGLGTGLTCHDVSPAEIHWGGAKRLVWLPNTLNRDQVIKEWRGKAAVLTRERDQLKGEVEWLRRQLKESDKQMKEAVEAATRPLERKIKRLKRAKGRRNNRVKR